MESNSINYSLFHDCYLSGAFHISSLLILTITYEADIVTCRSQDGETEFTVLKKAAKLLPE